jgi:hypothetical protein
MADITIIVLIRKRAEVAGNLAQHETAARHSKSTWRTSMPRSYYSGQVFPKARLQLRKR